MQHCNVFQPSDNLKRFIASFKQIEHPDGLHLPSVDPAATHTLRVKINAELVKGCPNAIHFLDDSCIPCDFCSDMCGKLWKSITDNPIKRKQSDDAPLRKKVRLPNREVRRSLLHDFELEAQLSNSYAPSSLLPKEDDMCDY